MELEALLAEGSRAHEEGRREEADRRYREVLERAPEHPAALYRLAMLAFEGRRGNECVALLERAHAAEPENPEYPFRLGHVLALMNRPADAVPHLKNAARLAPGAFEIEIKLGALHHRLGHREQALAAFQRAALLRPRLGNALSDPKLPADLRREIGIAVEQLREKHRSFAEATLDHVRSLHPGEDLARLETAVRALCGDRKLRYRNPMQRPALLYLPGVPERAWFEPSEFAWAGAVEDAYPAIRDELENLVGDEAPFVPYVQGEDALESAAGTDWSSLRDSMGWNALHLYRNHERIAENCARCPRTAALVDELPVPRIRNQSPELFFSRLRPGAHIVPHFGLMNARLTVHLGLVIPEGCTLRAGNETRAWQAGQLLIFDDSFEHEAWNRSTSERAVLIFEAWHPDLTEAEIAGVQRVFELRRDWLDQFRRDIA